MKRIAITFSAFALMLVPAFAQDAAQQAAADAAAEIAAAPEETAPVEKPKYWAESVTFNLGFNWTNPGEKWAAGGYRTTTMNSNIDAKADYAKDLMTWNNRLQLDYGFLSSADKSDLLQKNNDRLYFESKWAYKTGKDSKASYTASFDFRSQFTDTPAGYVQDAEGNWKEDGLKSGFISPAYTNIALGIQWNPTSWFDINVAPLTGGYTIVMNEILRPNYGMKELTPAVYDTVDPTLVITPATYKSALFQFGAQVKANFKLAINDNLKYETQAVVFTDYLSEPYFRINWDQSLDWQLSKLVKLSAKTWMIYDPLVTVALADGTSKKGPVQWKEFVSFSFTYSFNWKN